MAGAESPRTGPACAHNYIEMNMKPQLVSLQPKRSSAHACISLSNPLSAQKAFVLFTGWGFVICRPAYHMEQRSGRGQEAAWRASFQRIYLSQLVAELRRGRIDQRATRLSARTRAVKLAADLSLAMTARGRSTWRQAILGKYLFRLKKSRCQRRVVNSRGNSQGKRKSRVVNSRGNSQGKRKSVSAKARPCKRNAASENSCRQLPGPDSGVAGFTSLLSRDNCDKEAGGTVDSRMQTLRALVPGSHGLDTPIFLKEAADYIVALKMQVQAMKALADCYSDSNAHAACPVWK